MHSMDIRYTCSIYRKYSSFDNFVCHLSRSSSATGFCTEYMIKLFHGRGNITLTFLFRSKYELAWAVRAQNNYRLTSILGRWAMRRCALEDEIQRLSFYCLRDVIDSCDATTRMENQEKLWVWISHRFRVNNDIVVAHWLLLCLSIPSAWGILSTTASDFLMVGWGLLEMEWPW